MLIKSMIECPPDVELDRVVLNRIKDMASLPAEDRNQVFKVIDALIRDYKASNK